MKNFQNVLWLLIGLIITLRVSSGQEKLHLLLSAKLQYGFIADVSYNYHSIIRRHSINAVLISEQTLVQHLLQKNFIR